MLIGVTGNRYGYNRAMDVTPIFDALNDAQREAVGAPSGPLLGISRRRQR